MLGDMVGMLKDSRVRCVLYIWCVFLLFGIVWIHKSYAMVIEDPVELRYDIRREVDMSGYIEESKDDFVYILRLMDEYNKRLSEDERERYVVNIFLWSRIYGLNVRLVAAVIARESSFRQSCRSGYNAVGCMQIYIKAHEKRIAKLGLSEDEVVRDIGANIQVGCDIIREYLGYKSVNGDMEKALRRYAGLWGSKRFKTNWYYDDVKYIMETGKHPEKNK